VSNFNFFAQPELPRPFVTIDDARAIAREIYGLEGELSELGSQQDRNFLIRNDTDGEKYVLKFANPAFSRDELGAQDAALRALANAGVEVARVVPTLGGHALSEVEVEGGAGIQHLLIRMLTYLDGEPLADTLEFTVEHARALGATSGAVAVGLRDLVHPGAQRTTQWDLRAAPDVVELLLEHVKDPIRRTAVAEASRAAATRLGPLRLELRSQPIHGDVTDDNVVRTAGPNGSSDTDTLAVIDFGDVAEGWLVGELASTCASVLHHKTNDPLLVLETISAFAERATLNDPEIAALWPLVVLRAAVLVVSGEQQTALDSDNEYAEVRQAGEWRDFEVATSFDYAEIESLIRWAVQRPAAVEARGAVALLGTITADAVLDFSVTSPDLADGAWLEPNAEQDALARIFPVHEGHEAALTRYGEYRLTRARLNATRPVPTLALGVEAFLAPGAPLFAPAPGLLRHHTLESGAPALTLDTGDYVLWLEGVEAATSLGAPTAVADEEVIAMVATDGSVRAQLSTLRASDGSPGSKPPFFVRPLGPRSEGIWRRICPDPSGLLRLDVAAPSTDQSALLALRDSSFATVQEHYYENPPEIERGWRHHLVDTKAQTYVDMVNNVATTGHAHPRLTRAVAEQWSLLNTNSRFHYRQLAEFSARLAELAPEGLDTVFLVNSGSEAVDLALQLAQVATDRQLVLAVREAYHGWTMGADGVSSSLGDNPRALETRPPWVQLIESPHPVRGKYRGPDAAAGYLADLDEDLAELDASGQLVAGFIAEPVFGNAGGVLLPDGYLPGVYERIRARGGICIADEVQVGYGRLGSYFWGSEQQGVVPDIITIAKAMGNGQPLGAVITRRSIADAFAASGSFFSSAGGSPVSCRVGTTVLDIMEDEDLVENARVVGGHLKSRLEELGERFTVIGAVYGLGLYLGVELVTDRESFAPATEAAHDICEALLHEGVILQPTGDYKNVLKIKPPLCITRESVDVFVDALERVLVQES
jgi:4-aminobutyrate aminotransferase-like enzyme/Ser/Thr protein kinase RdoA (MazF antagonist)